MAGEEIAMIGQHWLNHGTKFQISLAKKGKPEFGKLYRQRGWKNKTFGPPFFPSNCLKLPNALS